QFDAISLSVGPVGSFLRGGGAVRQRFFCPIRHGNREWARGRCPGSAGEVSGYQLAASDGSNAGGGRAGRERIGKTHWATRRVPHAIGQAGHQSDDRSPPSGSSGRVGRTKLHHSGNGYHPQRRAVSESVRAAEYGTGGWIAGRYSAG